MGNSAPLSWQGIVRLGLVQTALGAIVVLTTSTLNRVMVVELALPAALPGALVALHYAVQMLRPRLGYSSDVGGRPTRWIIGGMATLAVGGIGAALATAWMGSAPVAGIAMATLAFILIGIGVGASGTTLLALLAKRVDPSRRAAAATIVWVMMIAGMAITATLAGGFLEPFSPIRLVVVTMTVAGAALVLTLLAVWGGEVGDAPSAPAGRAVSPPPGGFGDALRNTWADPTARRFTIFVFVSMLAYSAQDLILEPFAGLVFGLNPGQSTRLGGIQHGGALAGMILVAVAASLVGGPRLGSLRGWAVGGCIASGVALGAIAIGGFFAPIWPLRASVFALGLANGAFAVAAIGSMMGLAGTGEPRRLGIRMGLFGAAQAIAFGLGGLLGTLGVDLARHLLASPLHAYALVFAGEALMFLVAAGLAAGVRQVRHDDEARTSPATAARSSPVEMGAA